MAQIIDLLVIDDNKDFCNSLKNTASLLGEDRNWVVYITDFQNLEEGFAEFAKEIKYKGVILDGKCVIKKGTSDDFDFLPVALDHLAEININTGRIHTPFVINTGFYTEIKTFMTTQIELRKGKIFDKSVEEEKMLNFLFDAIAVSPNARIEVKYADVFEVFEKGYLGNEQREHLLNLLKNMENTQITDIRSNLVTVRLIKESVREKLTELKLFNSQPSLISQFDGYLIKNVSGEYGAHPPKFFHKNNDIVPTKYSVITLVHALLEILLWFKTEMEKNKK